jgi:hypothetical protein
MAQTEILAADTTADTSTDVTVASGGVATFSLKTSSGQVPYNIGLPIYLDNGPSEVLVAVLTRLYPTIAVDAPGVYRVKRELISDYGISVGVSCDQ